MLVNILVSLLFALPAAYYLGQGTRSWWLGLGAFLYCLWFEYAYHRWFQHSPTGYFADQHRLHHGSYRKANESEHLGFGGNWMSVFVLFFQNGILVWFLNKHWVPLCMLVFVAYFNLMEWVHERIHRDKWLPFNIGHAHHHRHHQFPPANFNVFIPLFDYLFGTKRRSA